MTFLSKLNTRTAILLAGSLFLQGVVGLYSFSKAAQPSFEDYHHRDRLKANGDTGTIF